MAAARKCDRCGTFYTANTKNPRLNYVAKGVSILKSGVSNVASQTFDFCDNCMNDFLTFVFDYEPPVPEEPDTPENPDEPVTPPESEGDSTEEQTK